MAKIVYKDQDYTKVARGNYTEDEFFVTVTDPYDGSVIKIGKRFIISIKETGNDD